MANKIKGIRAFVTWCRGAEYYTESGWRGSLATEGGGVLINQSIHTLDLLIWTLGDPTGIRANCGIFSELLEGKMNRAVQTCGHCSGELFKKVLDRSDYILFDIKIVDDDTHKKYTGVSNKLILENFKTLAHSGKDFVIRTPLIPTVTDTVENITAIARLLSENGVNYIELLPYNKMAGSKYKLAGMEYSPSFDTEIPCETRTEIFESFGIKAKTV